MSFDEVNNLNNLLKQKDQEIQKLKQALESWQLKVQNESKDIKEFYENILALMPGHIYWMDKNNVFLGCNDLQAKNAGLSSRKDIIGKTNFDMPWKDEAEKLDDLNRKVMETGNSYTAEEYAVMADGTSIYLLNKTPLRDNKNQIIGILGHSINITERKKMEVALKHAKEKAELANRLKGEFIINMTQDIHTPLNGIIDISHSLSKNLTNPQDKQYAQWCYQSAKQLLQLLDNLFYIVKNDKILDTDTEMQPFKLSSCLEEITNLLYPKLKLNAINLSMDIEPNLPDNFLTDGLKLQRILLNLIINALQITKSNTLILKIKQITNDTVYSQLSFCISDANSKLLTNPASKDLNLDIAKKYVGLLGGEIGLEEGAMSFTLSLKRMS